MIDGCGRILNWLFGISTTKELYKVWSNHQVEKLSTETTGIVHAIETHTTHKLNHMGVASQLRKNGRPPVLVSDARQRTREHPEHSWQSAHEMEWDWKTRGKIDKAFQSVDLRVATTAVELTQQRSNLCRHGQTSTIPTHSISESHFGNKE